MGSIFVVSYTPFVHMFSTCQGKGSVRHLPYHSSARRLRTREENTHLEGERALGFMIGDSGFSAQIDLR